MCQTFFKPRGGGWQHYRRFVGDHEEMMRMDVSEMIMMMLWLGCMRRGWIRWTQRWLIWWQLQWCERDASGYNYRKWSAWGHVVRGAHELISLCSWIHSNITSKEQPQNYDEIRKFSGNVFVHAPLKSPPPSAEKIVLSICWGKLPALGESVANYCQFFPSRATGEARAQL